MQQRRLLMKTLAGTLAYPIARMGWAGGQAEHFTNAVLQTQDGRRVRFYDDLVKGKLVVFNMMYTVCSGRCPVNTASMLSVQRALGDRVGRDIFFYSITLQPEIDTPAALRDYVRKYDIQPGWTFLTGKRADTEAIRRSIGFYDTDPVADADLNSHTAAMRIGNDRHDRWLMTPLATPTRQIVKSILNMV